MKKTPDAPTFPFEFSHSGRKGKIYKLGNGTFATKFTFAGGRKQNTHASFPAAVDYLRREFSTIDTDTANALSLRPLNYTVRDYGELEHLLRDKAPGVSLRDTVNFYLAHNKTKKLVAKTCQECADSFLAYQKANNISRSQLATLKKHYKRFNGSFGSRLIHEIDANEANEWLISQEDEKTGKVWAIKTRTTNRGSLVSLSLYAQDILKAVPSGDKTEFQRIPIPKKEHKAAVEIYTPDEMHKMLLAALEYDVALIPVFIMSGFQGLRPSEVHGEGTDHPPLSWDAFIWHDGQIEIRYQKIRSKMNRDLAILDATKAWLEPFMDETGSMWPYVSAHSKKTIALREKSGVRSVINGLRHSYASYRIRHLKNDLNELAREMGNSPAEIIDSYKRNVKDADADKWFASSPPAGYVEKVKSLLELNRTSLTQFVEPNEVV